MKADRENNKHFLILSLGSVLGQALNFFTVPLLTRLYLPEDFALWAIIISTTSLIGIGATFRLELTIPIEKDNKKSHFIFFMSLLSVLVISVISLPFLYAFMDEFFGLGYSESIEHVFWTIPFLIFFSGVQQTSIHWYIKTGDMLSISVLNFCTVVFIALLQIFFKDHFPTYGLILGSTVGQGAASILGLILLKRFSVALFREFSFSHMKDILVKYKVYPLLITPYTFLNACKDRFTIVILSQFLTKDLLGFFSVAQRVMNLPVTISGYTFRPVLFYRANQFDASLAGLIGKVQRLILIVFLIIAAVLYGYRRELFGFVFGNEWQIAGDYAFVLLPYALALSLFLWMDRLFDVYGKQREVLIFELIVSSIYIFGLYGLLQLSLGVNMAVFCMGFVLLLAYCLWDYYLMLNFNRYGIVNGVRFAAICLCLFIGWLAYSEAI